MSNANKSQPEFEQTGLKAEHGSLKLLGRKVSFRVYILVVTIAELLVFFTLTLFLIEVVYWRAGLDMSKFMENIIKLFGQ